MKRILQTLLTRSAILMAIATPTLVAQGDSRFASHKRRLL